MEMSNPEAAWLSVSEEGGLVVTLRVTPGGRRTEIVECTPARFRVRLNAPAVDGKANAELVRFLAELFEVRRSAVTIVRGWHTREKTVEISRPTPFFRNWFS